MMNTSNEPQDAATRASNIQFDKKKHNKKYYKLVNKDYVCSYRKPKSITTLLSHNENRFSFYF